MKVKLRESIPVAGAGNLKKDSVHTTVPCPDKYRDRYASDVWVQGEVEPVRLHSREYDIVDTSEPDHPAYQIAVVGYDMKKLARDLSKQLQENEEFKGKDFEFKDKLARIKNENIITDKEACFYKDIHKGIQLDVYRASYKELDEDGNETGVTKMFMFPACTVTLTKEDLKPYELAETNLAEFMGDRFGYNPRIRGNMDYLMKELK